MVTFRKLGKLGRFGNQMVQYAGVRLLASTCGYKAVFPHWIGCEIFNDVKPWSNSESLIAKLLPTVTLSDMNSLSRKEKFLSLLGVKAKRISLENLYTKHGDNIDIYGYLQEIFAISQLKKNRELIKQWFTFKSEISRPLEDELFKYKPWIGVHIRRTDFVKRGLAMPIEIYVEHIRKYYPNDNIYISTDDSETRKAFSEFKILNIKNPSSKIPDFVFDFWMLSRSKILLGCGSTFSWWAAFLSESGRYFSPPLTHLIGDKNSPYWKELRDESFI